VEQALVWVYRCLASGRILLTLLLSRRLSENALFPNLFVILKKLFSEYRNIIHARQTDIHLDEALWALVKTLAMNLLDMIIIVIMIFLIVRGIIRGFFMEIASLAGVILGILLGLRLHPRMTEFFRPYLPSIDVFILQLVSFTVIFAIVVVLCNFSGWGLKVLLKKASLGWSDKSLGAALAIIKGIIIVYLAIVMLTIFVPSKAPLVTKSRLAPLIISSYQSIVSLISPETYQNWKRRFIGQKKRFNETVSKKIEGDTGKDGY